jgi:hypothetical protein
VPAASFAAAVAERRRVEWKLQPQPPKPPWFYWIWPLRGPLNFFLTTAARWARLQANLDHVRLAVALERHWLRHRAQPRPVQGRNSPLLARRGSLLVGGEAGEERVSGEENLFRRAPQHPVAFCGGEEVEAVADERDGVGVGVAALDLVGAVGVQT